MKFKTKYHELANKAINVYTEDDEEPNEFYRSDCENDFAGYAETLSNKGMEDEEIIEFLGDIYFSVSGEFGV